MVSDVFKHSVFKEILLLLRKGFGFASSLCAKVSLPSQIWIISPTKNRHYHVGTVFPRDVLEGTKYANEEKIKLQSKSAVWGLKEHYKKSPSMIPV